MSDQRKKLLTVLGVTLIFFLGYTIGQRNFQVQNGKITFINQNPPREQIVDFKLFWDVYATIQSDYYDKSKIDGQKLLYGAISGMVGSLGDPYTAFLNPEQNKEVKADLAGTYEGVGIQLGYKDSQLVVIAPLDGTPAKEAGIKAGERILKIGDNLTDGMTLPQAVTLIRGSAGTSVTLTLQKDSASPYTVALTRAQIKVKSVEFTDKGGGVGYIKLSRFADDTNTEWSAAVDQALSSGSLVLVLDMRDNPGGYLQSAVYIGSEFISSGAVVKQESLGKVKDFTTVRAGKLTQIPVVVIINGGSASASEIVAGALQDYGRATLLGDQSFGKGTIQEVDDIGCTADAGCPSLHITSAKWLTPKGRWINGTGLTPDIKVELSDEDIKAGRDPQLDLAIETALSKIK